MAILFIDGFDAYGVNGDTPTVALNDAGYTHFAGFSGDPLSQVTSDTRTGIGFALSPANWTFGGGITRNFKTAAAVVIGVAVKLNTSDVFAIATVGYNNYIGGIFSQLNLLANGANGITVQTGDGFHTYASEPNVLFEGVWQYLEIKYTPGISTSHLEVRVDGVAVISVTNENLQTTGAAALVNFVSLDGGGRNLNYVDDFYVLDQTGAAFNDFLGDVVVHPLFPIADVGGGANTFTQVGGIGGQHFTTVDDPSPDGDTTYVWGNTSGQSEAYTLSALPADIVEVLAVGVNVISRKEAPGVGTYKSFIKVGINKTDSPTFSAPQVYFQTQFILEAQPGGSPWTNTAAQNAEIGFEIP